MQQTHAVSRWAFLAWIPVTLTALVVWPQRVMSAHSAPRTFWAACAVACGLALIPPPRPARLRITPLGLVWLLYLGWMLLSLAWSLSPRVSIERFAALLLPGFAYLLACRTRFWEHTAFWIFFCILLLVLGLFGIVEFGQHRVAAVLEGLSPAAAAGFSDFMQSLPGTTRPRITFGNRNLASLFMVLSLPFAVGFALRSRGRRGMLAWTASAAVLGLVLMVRTRGAWAGLAAAGVFAAAAKWTVLRAWPARRTVLAFAALAALIVAVWRIVPAPGIELGRKEHVGDLDAHAEDLGLRLRWSRDALRITHPLLGAGPGCYPIHATPFEPDGRVIMLHREIHNDYVQAYADMGIVGAALMIALFAVLLRQAWKGRRDPVLLAAGAAVVGLAVMQSSTFTSSKIASQVWFAGVAAIVNVRAGPRPVLERSVPRWLAWSGNGVVVAWLLLFAAGAAYSIRGDRQFRRAQNAIHSLDRLPAAQREPVMRALRREMVRLSTDVLPTIQHNLMMKHFYSRRFTGHALWLEDKPSAERFARAALALHPHDRACLRFVAHLMFEQNRPEQGAALLDRYFRAFQLDLHSDIVTALCRYHESTGHPQKAAAVRAAAEAWTVETPADPVPANRASNVRADLAFQWAACRAAERYEVYLWKTGEQTPAAPAARVKANRWQPRTALRPDTVYFWRVKAVGRGRSEQSELWFFRTAKAAE